MRQHVNVVMQGLDHVWTPLWLEYESLRGRTTKVTGRAQVTGLCANARTARPGGPPCSSARGLAVLPFGVFLESFGSVDMD